MSNSHGHLPGIITSITVQKKNKNRFNIFINGQYSFSLNRSLAEALKPGDQLTKNRIKNLKQADEKDTAYSRALFYLKFRSRSRIEIERYLKGKNFSPEAVMSTLSRLAANEYINDFDFARLWIENRCRFKPKGSYALTGELKEKGIDEQIIKKTLKDFNELESAWAAIAPRLNRLEKLERNEFNKKIYSFLSYRGFDYSTCKQICDQAWEQHIRTTEEENK